jgi:hypothetical protein
MSAQRRSVSCAPRNPLAHLDALVDRLVTVALADHFIALTSRDEVAVKPPELSRADGTSVYVVAGSQQLYTSAAVR